MTIIEKILKDNPLFKKEDVMLHDCPFQYGLPDDFDKCEGEYNKKTCTKCWNRKYEE